MRLIYPALLLILFSATTEARMYQWNDPDTGTTQLSGKPPAWYRTGEGGPRIIVFDKGKIIDDTSIKISEVQRESLRQEALLQAEEDRQKAIEAVKEAEKMKTQINMATRDETPYISPEQSTVIPGDQDQEKPEKGEDEQEKLTEEKMRALISEWEQQKTEDARKKAGDIIEQDGPSE